MSTIYRVFALHYVFIPHLNKSLEGFVQSWNSHSLGTEHGHSPNQLFTAGALLSHDSFGRQYVDSEQIDESSYGIDEAGLAGSDDEIIIPQSIVVLSTQQEDSLKRLINPLADNNNNYYGIEIYEQTLDFLRSIIVGTSDNS